MRRSWPFLAVSLLALPALLGACSTSTREALGLTKRSPDEFEVVSNAPLSMPPDFGLRPPTPGAPRPQEGSVRDQAQGIVFSYPSAGLTQASVPEIGVGEVTSAQSAGEASFLQSAGTAGIDPNIRQIVDSETLNEEESSKQLIDAIVFWRRPEPYGTVVDPVAEQKRLQENAALGQPITQGDVPIIERKQKGLLEGLF